MRGVVAHSLPRRYWNFSKFIMAVATILDFFYYKWIWHVPPWWLSVSWALDQMWLKYLVVAENGPHLFLTIGWWRHANCLPVPFLVTWVSPHSCVASFYQVFVDIFISYRDINILLNSMWPPPTMLDLFGKLDHPRRPIHGGYSLHKFRRGHSCLKIKGGKFLCFFVSSTLIMWEHRSDPIGTCLNLFNFQGFFR